ncbi:MAG: RdgB/HAM1 family non-canonical purine NTP pyrophosphatase [Pirellulaceae bacterium]|nr:RdgB/HAM1 family non-canonical purine NTP pyrophosphatase [Pirellulaceae bacterium]
MRQLVLGTHNKKKGAELESMLAPFSIIVKTLQEYENPIEVIENGSTFAENAQKKAREQALHLNEWVLGEDSGLCVVALDHRPGIFSARYSGEGATDDKNNKKLLEALLGIPAEKRQAYYVCHMSLASPSGEIILDFEEHCCGLIETTPRGDGGFGYDPLFKIAEYHSTFGELGAPVKKILSHRGRAMRKLLKQLQVLGWFSG